MPRSYLGLPPSRRLSSLNSPLTSVTSAKYWYSLNAAYSTPLAPAEVALQSPGAAEWHPVA